MCIHVYEGDSDQEVAEAHAEAARAVAEARGAAPTWVSYLEAQLRRIEREVIRRWLVNQERAAA